MATVSVESAVTAGLAATYNAADAAGSDKFAPGDGVVLHVKNASAASINATLVTPGTVDGLAVADRVVAVPASGERFILCPAHLYRNPSDGLATAQWSATASVTFAAVRA
jgi:hypothetical protein